MRIRMRSTMWRRIIVICIVVAFIFYEVICSFRTKAVMKYAQNVMEGDSLLSEDVGGLRNIQYHAGDHYSESVDISLIPILYFMNFNKERNGSLIYDYL